MRLVFFVDYLEFCTFSFVYFMFLVFFCVFLFFYGLSILIVNTLNEMSLGLTSSRLLHGFIWIDPSVVILVHLKLS